MLALVVSSRSAIFCVLAVTLSHPIAARAQSADEVIERHIKAIGGKAAIEKVANTDVSGTVSAADGQSGVFTQRTMRPHSLYLSLDLGSSRLRAGFNGRSAWQDDGREGLRTLYGEAASRVRADASYANGQYIQSEKVRQMTVVGRDQVRGRPVIVLDAITPDGFGRKLFFDAGSYLLVRDEQTTDAGMDTRFFDDYRSVDEVMTPHRIEWQRQGETLVIVVERVVHNASVDERMFDTPAPPTEPPLDLATVISAAERNEQRAAQLLAAYSYTLTETMRTIDRSGRTTQHELQTYEVFHLGDRPVARLLGSGGQPLSEAARRREDARVKNLVREYEQRRLSGEAGRSGRGERGPVRSVRDLFGSVIAEMPMLEADWFAVYLRMAEFSNVRRERLRGRTAAVVEFQPRRGAVATNDFERQVGRTAGTLWIDETSEQVIRIESHFVDSYEQLVQGSSMRTERTLVDGEVWLPFRSELNLRRNLNLFGAFPVSASHPLLLGVQFTGHRKFSVDTAFEIALPGPAR
jgi:hypothetical protein